MRVVTRILLLTGCCVLLLASCLEEVPEELSSPIPEIPAPFGLAAVVGDGEATLAWSYDTNFSYSQFILYRSEDDGASWQKAVGVTAPPITISTLRNGYTYWFKVAGVDGEGIEGSASTSIAVRTALFGLLINQGEEYANSRDVILNFTAPAQTQSIIFSDDSLFTNSSWVDYAITAAFKLSPNDGTKKVFAKFKDEVGNPTLIVSDEVILDTRAEIEDADFTPQGALSPGSSIHFSIITVNREKEGKAEFSIEGLEGTIVAMDNGLGGDTQAYDGIYERDYALLSSFRSTGAIVTCTFTDAAENTSEAYELPTKIIITDPPQPVYFFPAVDSTTSSITLQWSESDDDYFSRYELYRDVSQGVSRSTSYRVALINDRSTVLYTDVNLEEAKSYFYRIYVVNDLGEAQGSIVRQAETDDIPPDPVTCDPLSSIGSDRVTLTWNVNMNTDFLEYRVYRSASPGVTDTNGVLQGSPITDRYHAYYDDSGLDLVSNIYYYRVYVLDRAQNKSRSNEVSTQ